MLTGIPAESIKLLAAPALVIDGGLWNPAFQYAVLMTNILTFSQIYGTIFFFKVAGAARIEKHLPIRATYLTTDDLVRASYCFLAIYLCAFYLLASAELGLVNWLKNPRVGYQLYRTGQGHWYAIALNALSVAAILSFLATPSPTAIILKTIVFLAMAYALGSKAIMLSMFTASMIMLFYIRWQHLGKFFLFASPIIFGLLIWNLYLALSDGFELRSIVEYFDYYINATEYYAGILNREISLFYGEIFTSSFWAYVPRALVPDKPFVYGILHINEIFYPGQAELTNTPAFGGAVEQYADFGILGVLFFGFFSSQAALNGILFHLLFRAPRMTVSRVNMVSFLAFLALFGPLFGIYFQGIYYWPLIFIVYILVRATERKRRIKNCAVTPV